MVMAICKLCPSYKKLAASNDGAPNVPLASLENPYPSFGSPIQSVASFPSRFSS